LVLCSYMRLATWSLDDVPIRATLLPDSWFSVRQESKCVDCCQHKRIQFAPFLGFNFEHAWNWEYEMVQLLSVFPSIDITNEKELTILDSRNDWFVKNNK
jgi:hypothetical protein